MEKDTLVHMRTAKVRASLRIRGVSSEPMLFAHVNGRSMGNQTTDMRPREGPGMRIERSMESPRSIFLSQRG